MSCACAQDYVEDMLDLLQYKQLKKVAGVCVECVEAKVPGLLMTLLGYVGYGMSLG